MKNLRKWLGLSQLKMAVLLHTSTSTIHRHEKMSGRFNPTLNEAIALLLQHQQLGTPVDTILEALNATGTQVDLVIQLGDLLPAGA